MLKVAIGFLLISTSLTTMMLLLMPFGPQKTYAIVRDNWKSVALLDAYTGNSWCASTESADSQVSKLDLVMVSMLN